LGNAGELPAVGNGGATASFPNSGQPLPSSKAGSDLSRPIKILWLNITHTPSWVLLLKNPPVFIYLNPPSLVYSQNTHSHSENVVSSV
jgi:hypothetical protein